ncbi:hypothetical protein MJT46_005775 [Ovis ammon polii x Ovis aries]|nr:hypothetical protein MJT46_005775 [Ovis ammon polii x Ovis aries]
MAWTLEIAGVSTIALSPHLIPEVQRGCEAFTVPVTDTHETYGFTWLPQTELYLHLLNGEGVPPGNYGNYGYPNSGYSACEEENERLTESLRNKVTAIKSLSIEIGHEVKHQNKLLAEMDSQFDSTTGFLGNNAEICLLPLDDGPCRARIPSYYYDRYTQSCREFMYGGCEGNANNFETLEACNEACWKIEKVPKICRLKVNKKQCGELREQYFFNLSSMTCEKFISGGCHSDENRFPDKASCMDFCAPKRAPAFCYSPKDEGLCSANVTRYYFNPRHKACEAFTYTGCGGNDNNFVNLKDCKRTCVKVLLIFDTEDVCLNHPLLKVFHLNHSTVILMTN